MKKKRAKSNWGITMPAIRRYALQIAEKFQPDKIILFGSQANGDAHPDSDVDLMVIMPAKNGLDQAFKIRCAIDSPFPLDLLVCTPKKWKLRLEDGEWFIKDMNENGIVLYERSDTSVDQESRGGLSGRSSIGNGKRPIP